MGNFLSKFSLMHHAWNDVLLLGKLHTGSGYSMSASATYVLSGKHKVSYTGTNY
jgi:hypothetical protein